MTGPACTACSIMVWKIIIQDINNYKVAANTKVHKFCSFYRGIVKIWTQMSCTYISDLCISKFGTASQQLGGGGLWGRSLIFLQLLGGHPHKNQVIIFCAVSNLALLHMHICIYAYCPDPSRPKYVEQEISSAQMLTAAYYNKHSLKKRRFVSRYTLRLVCATR